MTHRAETILNTIEGLLTGLATTGANVQRARVWPVDSLPALSIYKSDDLRSIEDALDNELTRELTVNINIHVKQTGNVETVLNQVAAEIFAAMSVDKTLGLAYVFNALLIGETEPLIEDSQDTPNAQMVSGWLVTYQHSDVSAEA